MPVRACIVCGSPSIPGGSRCPNHVRSNWDRWKKRTAERQSYYSSSAWQERRKRQLAEHPYCVRCGAKASDADHVNNLAAGGDPDGPLDSLCADCHRRKTASEGGKAAKLNRQKRQQ